MSEALDEMPPSPDSSSEDLETMVATLGTMRAEFLTSIDTYVARPRTELYTNAVDASMSVTDAFLDTMKFIYKDPLTSDDAKARIGASLLQEDGRSRVSHIKQRMPSAELKRQPESWDEVYANLFSLLQDDEGHDRADFPHFVTSMHEFDLVQDLENLRDSCGKKPRARLERLGGLVLAHSIDISKTAIGTAIGAGIALYIERH